LEDRQESQVWQSNTVGSGAPQPTALTLRSPCDSANQATTRIPGCRSTSSRERCEIDGAEYRQGAFTYQDKCLQWLREAYADLDADDRAHVDTVLAGTGCEALLA
jgi:hypothetical protein